jgi:hypothetical protein
MANSFKAAGRELTRWALRIAIVAMLALALDSFGVLAYLPFGQVRDQSPFGTRPIKRVKSDAEIRAKTPDDLARAAYFDFAAGQKLMDVEGIILAGPETPPPSPLPPDLTPTRPPDPFREGICAADAVIVGEATKDRVLLNKSETFLISVHEVSVSEWIRSGGNKWEVSVSVAGGVVQVGEKTLHARSGTFPDLFRLAILKLKMIPRGGGYALTGEPVALPPTAATPNKEGSSEREALLTKYREAAASCKEGGR